MRAVIFGGSGFLGTHLAHELAAQKAEVVIADLLPPRSLAPGATYIRSDIREPIDLAHPEPFDAVYNFAAIHRTPGHEASEYYETNVTGAVNIAEWCEAGGEQYIFFTSSIAVYGSAEWPTTEQTAPEPRSHYGRSKLEAEQIHRLWRHRNGAERRLIITRPAAIFGAGEMGNFTRLAANLRARRFMYPGTRDVLKACGYVEDFLHALMFAESLGESELTYNFAYPHPSTTGEVCDAFRRVAGFPAPLRLPRPMMSLGLFALSQGLAGERGRDLGERIQKLLTSTYVVPQELAQRGFSWKTDIESGLKAWHDDDPVGEFV